MEPDDQPNTAPVILTPDGSHTAYNARFDEAYGSRHGARGQAQHVFLQGTQTDVHSAPQVLEIGFGVGVNFLTTLVHTAQSHKPLHYIAYEFDPAPVEVLQAVAEQQEGADHPLWQQLLQHWPQHTPSNPSQPSAIQFNTIQFNTIQLSAQRATLELHFCDVLKADLPQAWASAVYLDGFSPRKNPEVWTPQFASRLAQSLQAGGFLATYSAAGHVRRALENAGLIVTKRVGATGKRECVQAKRPDVSDAPDADVSGQR